MQRAQQQHGDSPGCLHNVERYREPPAQAEQENARLRLGLEQQLKIAKGLERKLKPKLSTQDVTRSVVGRRFHGLYSSRATRYTDNEIFGVLIPGLDRSYARVDAVFQGNGLANKETELSDARMRFDAFSGMCLEIFTNKVLPFDMHAVANAAWQHFIFGKQRTPSRYYDYIFTMHARDDTIVENFNVGLHANNTSGYLRTRQVFRRYVEDERVVIVFRSVFFPVQVADVATTDVSFRSTTYIVIQRPLERTRPERGYSLLQTNYNYASLVGGDHPKVGVVTDFMLRATEANIRARNQMLENALLAATCAAGG